MPDKKISDEIFENFSKKVLLPSNNEIKKKILHQDQQKLRFAVSSNKFQKFDELKINLKNIQKFYISYEKLLHNILDHIFNFFLFFTSLKNETRIIEKINLIQKENFDFKYKDIRKNELIFLLIFLRC